MTWSIWGTVQQENKIVRGITQVSTATHGGYVVSKGKCTDAMKEVGVKRGNYWYFEEDCDWAVVALCCWNDFYKTGSSDNLKKAAIKICNIYHKEWLEKWFPNLINHI